MVWGFWLITVYAIAQQAPSLGAFFEYNVAGKQGVTNTLETTMPGKLASADAAATGFPPGVALRGIDNQNTAATQAIAAAQAAYTAAASLPGRTSITASNFASGTFTSGVYEFSGNATISNNINLNSQTNPNAVFIFIIRGSLTVNSGVTVNTSADTKVSNIIWVVESDLAAGSTAGLRGNYLVRSNVSLAEGANVNGRIASLTGTVTLNKNTFTIPNDLETTLAKSPGSMGENYYMVGETITYTVDARNIGPIDDPNVTVSIRFTGSDQVFSPSAGTVSPGPNGEWIWAIGRMNVGETRRLTVTAKMTATNAGILTADIRGTNVDDNRDNNGRTIQNFCTVLPKPGDIEGPAELCIGVSGVYRVPIIPGIEVYSWEVPSFMEIVSGHNTNEITVRATRENTNIDASIQVFVTNDCFQSPRSTIRITNAPPIPDQPGPINAQEGICTGTVAFYSITAVDRATNYVWGVPSDWRILNGQGTTRIEVMPGETEGNISVIAENQCGQSAPRTLAVKPFLDKPAQPTAISGGGNLTVCFDEDRVTFSVQASADVTDYLWKNWPAAWTLVEGQGTSSITFDPNGVAGSVTISGINPCGTSDLTFTLQVIPDQPIVPGEISGDFPVCKGSTGTRYWIAEVAYATEYNWAVPNGWRITSGQGTREITVDLDPDAQSGEIAVLVINACGKEGRTKKNVEATTAKPIAPASITGDAFTCITTEAFYATNAVAGAQDYVWEVPQGWQILEGQGTTRIKVRFGAQEGDILVRARNSCGISEPAVLRVKPFSPIPNIPFVITGPQNGICVRQTNVVFQLDPVDQAQRYTWSFPTGWRIVEGQGTNRITVDVGTQSGTIRVTAENPCGESQAASLAITLQPDVPAPKPGPITGQSQYCAGKNQTYSISPVNGAVAYQWTFPGADWEVIGDRNGTSITVKAGATQGQVQVAAINNCGTVGQSTTLALQLVGEVPPAPSAIISETDTYCGNATNLGYRVNAVPTATSYIWTVPAGWTITSGANTNQIKVTAGVNGGEVTVRAVNSCGESQSIKVVTTPQRPLMNPEAIQGPAIPCRGRTDAVYSIPAIDGAETYEWVLPAGWKFVAGRGTNSITVEVAGRGEIKVRARNACGVTAEAKMTVEVVTAAPVAPAAITGETLTCATRNVTYSVAPVAHASTYTWTVPAGWAIVSGQGTTQVTVQMGTASGEITVQAANDCDKSTATALGVTARPLPVISRIIDRTLACSDIATFELESDSPGGTFTWQVPAGWEILTGQGTSIITVQQGNAKGDVTVVAYNGECTSNPVTIYSDPSLREAALNVPNVFTPNNDGNNDTWIIGNLGNYPSNEIVVVNRWGNEVYRAKSYQNNWNGDRLAEGTYYYVVSLTLCDGTEKSYKGYVMIVR